MFKNMTQDKSTTLSEQRNFTHGIELGMISHPGFVIKMLSANKNLLLCPYFCYSTGVYHGRYAPSFKQRRAFQLCFNGLIFQLIISDGRLNVNVTVIFKITVALIRHCEGSMKIDRKMLL